MTAISPGMELLHEQLRPPAPAHGAAHGGHLQGGGALHRPRVYAAFSSSRAWRRAAASSASAPSIRTSSPTTSRSASSRHRRQRGLGARVLGDREVAGGERGDLRQVRDAEDLAALGERAQPLADGARGLAADAGVDLVEDERRGRPVVARRRAARASRARARRRRRSRAAGPPGRRGWARAGTRPRRRRSGPGSRAGSDDLEARALHRQLGERARDRLGQPRRRLRRAPRAARRRAARARRARLGQPRGRLLERDLGVRELVVPRAAALGVLEHRRDRAAVLALQPVDGRQALLGGLERARLGLEPLGVARAARRRGRSAS